MSFVIHLWCDLHVLGWTVYFLCQPPISLILWPWATEVKNLDLNLFSSNLGNIRNRMWCFNEVTEFLRGRGVPAPGRCCLRQFRAALTPVLEMVLLRLFELLFKRFGAVSTKTCYRNKKSGPSVWAYSVIHFNISTSHFKTCSFHYFSIKMLFGFILLQIPEKSQKAALCERMLISVSDISVNGLALRIASCLLVLTVPRFQLDLQNSLTDCPCAHVWFFFALFPLVLFGHYLL